MRKEAALAVLVALLVLACVLSALGALTARPQRPTRTFPVGPQGPVGAQKIPRIVHQTHSVGYDAMPGEYKEQCALVRATNPEYEYRFYAERDREAFLSSVYGADSEHVRAYRSIDAAYGPARADLFRYMLLYEHGGVYLDVKSSTAPLRDVIRADDEYLLSSWCEGECGKANWESMVRTGVGEYQQWWIACAPRHPFLRAVIEKCLANVAAYRFDASDEWTFGKRGVLKLTGPIPYTQAIFPLLGKHKHRLRTNSFDGAFLYSYALRGGGKSHEDVERAHYSRLTTPIVRRRVA
jgi:mannosyltransferase OCH1-like enzyme